MDNSEYVIRLKGISKHFGPVCALENIDFELKKGEILGLVGDNGAGKSTLIKIISGAVTADTGEIFFNEKHVDIRQPKDAFNLGIETIYQDLALFEGLDFTKNIFAGREYIGRGINRIFGFTDDRRMRNKALEKITNISINLPSLEQEIDTMSGGQRQAVAIARTIFWSKKVVIMDEPTAALGVQESKRVLELIKETINHVDGIILITHNIEHVLRIADRVVVLRYGKRAGDVDCSGGECSKSELHNKIVSLITGGI